MKNLMDKSRGETGMDLRLDEREFASSSDPWPYIEHGLGMSLHKIEK